MKEKQQSSVTGTLYKWK